MAMAEPLTDMDDHIHKSLSEALAGIDNCHKCGLGDTRTNVVPGAGNPRAKVMFIGEGPGEQEDRGTPLWAAPVSSWSRLAAPSVVPVREK